MKKFERISLRKQKEALKAHIRAIGASVVSGSWRINNMAWDANGNLCSKVVVDIRRRGKGLQKYVLSVPYTYNGNPASF